MRKTKNEEFSQEVPRFLLFFVCKGTGGLPVTDSVVGFLDDAKMPKESYEGFRYLGKVSEYYKYKDAFFVIAIGKHRCTRGTNKIK